jgi:hypothetical protein
VNQNKRIFLWVLVLPLVLWIIMLFGQNLFIGDFYYSEIYKSAGTPRSYYDSTSEEFNKWTFDRLRPFYFDYFFSRALYLYLVGQTFWLVRKKNLGFLNMRMIIFYLSLIFGTIPFLVIQDFFHLQVTGINPFFLWIVYLLLIYQLGLGIYVRMFRPL